MCGLVAVFNFSTLGLSPVNISVFTDLLIANSVRGSDGTGIMFAGDKSSLLVNQKEDIDHKHGWFKFGGDPFNLFQDAHKKHWENIKKSRFVVGHNRFATTGKVTHKNAHPFEYKHITLMHNGTIRGIDLPGININTYEVDSAAIADALSQDDDVIKVLGSIDGPAAIFWYNSLKGTMNLWKNYQRPLCYSKVGDTFYFASEGKMLSWVLDRHNAAGMNGISDVPCEQHIEWTHDKCEPKLTEARRMFPQPTIQKITPHTPVFSGDKANNNPPDKKTKVTHAIDNYHGMRKNGEIIFEVTNAEPVSGVDGEMKVVRGTVIAAPGSPFKWNKEWENVTALAYVKSKAYPNNFNDIVEAQFLKGKITSMTINQFDVNDLRCYVTDLAVIPPEEILAA